MEVKIQVFENKSSIKPYKKNKLPYYNKPDLNNFTFWNLKRALHRFVFFLLYKYAEYISFFDTNYNREFEIMKAKKKKTKRFKTLHKKKQTGKKSVCFLLKQFISLILKPLQF